MEKIINLFYEYTLDTIKREMRINWADEKEIELVDTEKLEDYELEEVLKKLSKLKSFVEWLVKNKKINFDLIKQVYWIPCFVQYDKWEIISVHDTSNYLQVIMFLSIQEEPLETLIDILK